MTDEQIEKLVMEEIEKRGITLYDMIGLSNANIDTDPEDNSTPVNQRARLNRFWKSTGLQDLENAPRTNHPFTIRTQDNYSLLLNTCITIHHC